MTDVRPAAPDDLAAVVGLDAVVFPDDPWDLAAWQGLVGTAGRRLLVAVEDDRLVGYALTGVVGDFAELLRIGTEVAQRRRGVARRLLAGVLRAAVEDGCDRVLLEVSVANAGARAFYATAGFTVIDRRPGYYRDGSAALVLERSVVTGVAAGERMDP